MVYIATFRSNFDAILANRTLLSQGVAVELMPTPRAVSSACGACVHMEAEAPPDALARLSLEGLYRKTGQTWEKMK